MESFMVKYYVKDIFSHDGDITDSKVHVLVMEDIVSLFLRIRGFAVARVERNRRAAQQSLRAKDKSSKKSRRKSLMKT
ncbi:hypothetical protein KP79_PYT22949 [Mizuhopecten yessoensis]|uniref:Uncharacterized protein n=1 Tax=Mizuhopecten yessoensis TaxID=6573 RepID=A0A210PSH7_MIZYE|nr:hypothetical protein KP79_PYT22949 [Mizuhopecten yessoensis]